jgi:hypothetical protein
LTKSPSISKDELNDHYLILYPTLDNLNGKVRPPSLVDSGGTGIAFMNKSYTHKNSFPVYPFSNPKILTIIDGRPIAGDILTHYT